MIINIAHFWRICDQLCCWWILRELWEALCKEYSAFILLSCNVSTTIKRTWFFHLRAMFLNSEWNQCNQSTKQDNERKRSENETNLLTLTCCVCLQNSFYLVNACVHWFQPSDLCHLFDLLLKQKDMIVSDNKRLF